MTKDVIECLTTRDEEALWELFCEMSKESDTLKDEICEGMEFVEGEIQSYNKQIADGEQASYRDGKIVYQSFDIRITKVETDCEKIYSVRVFCCTINGNEPEKVGISEIEIESENGEKIVIGEYIP